MSHELPAKARALALKTDWCPECHRGWEWTFQSSKVLDDIAAERQRQCLKGYDAAHDDKHNDGEIALGAALYAIPYEMPGMEQDNFIRLHMMLDLSYDWSLKPEPDHRKRLVKAAAMLVAEIERLDRKEKANG